MLLELMHTVHAKELLQGDSCAVSHAMKAQAKKNDDNMI